MTEPGDDHDWRVLGVNISLFRHQQLALELASLFVDWGNSLAWVFTSVVSLPSQFF